jgi:hypothetical protein
MGGKLFLKEEDKEIVRQAKNNKRQKRRENKATEEDHFEDLFDKYKTTLMKKLDQEDADKKAGKKSKKASEFEFEEVVMSD